MIPILFPETATAFTTNGIGRLADAIFCEVEEELNGMYELTLTYPQTGQYADEIAERMFIVAKPNQVSNPQPFRIYKVTKQAQGKRIVVNAQHLSYDLNGFPVAPFTATGVTPALSGLVTNSLLTNPFTTWTNITNTTSQYTQTIPASFRERLGGVRGSILDTFGGEFEWDGYTIKLHAHRGSNNGVSILYGKNLTEFENERSNESFYTGAMAYWEKDDEVVQGTIQYISDHSSYPNEKILILEADFDDPPTVEQLDNYAAEYIVNNSIGVPFKDSLKINFVPLWQTEEYKNVAPLERVSLGDTVHVKYKEFDVAMKVISYYFDVLTERYTEMELGAKKASLKDTISDPIREEVENTVSNVVSNLEDAIVQATSLLSGGLGGYVVINTNADGTPNEILILDQPAIEDAVNVIRMNLNGIGFSTTGYNGAFTNAWTIDGHLNADFIDVGTLNGNLLQAASVLTSALEVSAYDAVTGSIENITYDGQGMHIARKDDNGNIISEYQSLFTELGMRVINSNNEATLIAEQDTVDAVNLTSHNFLRVTDDAQGTTSRFQAFYNSIHSKAQYGIFWEQ